jgi:hypothetical protein
MRRCPRPARFLALTGLLGCGAPTAVSGSAPDGSSDPDTAASSTTEASTSGNAMTEASISSTLDGTSTEGDGTSTSETGSSYIIDPDGGGTACFAQSYCDVWAQDCPEGEKCLVWSADGDGDLDGCVLSRCSPIAADPVAVGGACEIETGPWSGVDDCDIGAYCWDVDPVTLRGVCVGNCFGNEANPLCTEGLLCFVGYNGWLTACVPGCDPLAPACPPGSACATGDGGASVCLPSSLGIPVAQAEACDHASGCGDGFACMAKDAVPGCADPASCCTALCDPEAPACGRETPVCTPLAGADGVGGCTVE